MAYEERQLHCSRLAQVVSGKFYHLKELLQLITSGRIFEVHNLGNDLCYPSIHLLQDGQPIASTASALKWIMPADWPSQEEFFDRALAVKPDLRVTLSSLQALILLHWYLYTEVSVLHVSGVLLPAFESYRTEGNNDFGLTGLGKGGQQVQRCRETYARAVEALVELASLQTAFVILDEVIKVVNRRGKLMNLFGMAHMWY